MFEATDAMLKAANVTFTGWLPVGGGLVTGFIEGDVAAVKAATDVGASAASHIGEVSSVQVIARPHDDLDQFIQQVSQKPAAEKSEKLPPTLPIRARLA